MSYLEIENITFAYNNGPVLKGLNLSVNAGEMVGILGPNGSGKTTLIKLISGVLQPKQGDIRLDNMSLGQFRRQAVARSIAVVPQEFDIPFAFRVEEVVMMGRTPFHGFFDDENQNDREEVASAIKLVGISNMADKHWNELSGGEKQKVVLATALAQSPHLLLLDEPTVHLDIANQVEILELVRSLNRERKLTVVAAIHDLNMAAMYFDRLVLLKAGRVLADGAPREVLTEDNIRQAFDAVVKVGNDPATGVPHVYILPQTREGKSREV